ncbi:MAG TPA: hypothetical protein VJO53_08385 [Candidatus Acidoferrales bacterium]|nr:hypothetical protein [Candidatus Acidoferrales bacterium]
MIRRGYRTYGPYRHYILQSDRPSIPDFPLVPETPVFVRPYPTHLQHLYEAAQAAAPAIPEATASTTPKATASEETPAERTAAKLVEALALAGASIPSSEEDPRAAIAETAATRTASDKATRRSPRKSAPAAARRRTRAARRRSRRKSRPLSTLTQHRARCGICNSSLQEEIEEDFVRWQSVRGMARHYSIEARAIYRHAHALGLFAIRDRNIRAALGHIIDHAALVRVTADSVIRAVRTLAHVNEAGEWIVPPTHVIVSSGAALQARNITPPAPKRLDTPCRSKKELKR